MLGELGGAAKRKLPIGLLVLACWVLGAGAPSWSLEISYHFGIAGDQLVEYVLVGSVEGFETYTEEMSRCLANLPEAHQAYLAPIYIVPTLPGGRTTGGGFYPREESYSTNLRVWLGRSERTGIPDAVIEEDLDREIPGVVAITHARLNSERKIHHLSVTHETAHALQVSGLELLGSGVTVADLSQRCKTATLREHAAEAYSRYISQPDRVCRRSELRNGESMSRWTERVVGLLRAAPAFASVPEEWKPVSYCRETERSGGPTSPSPGGDEGPERGGAEGPDASQPDDPAEQEEEGGPELSSAVSETVAGAGEFSSGLPESWFDEARERYSIPGMGELVASVRDGWPRRNASFGLIRGFNARIRANPAAAYVSNLVVRAFEEDPETAIGHVRWTLERFESELGTDPEEIDLAMVLVVKAREGGDLRPILRSDETQVCTAGKDTAVGCVSGLDWAYSQRRHYPHSMQGSIRALPQSRIDKRRRCSAAELRDGHNADGERCRLPALMPRRYLLAGAVVATQQSLRATFPANVRRVFRNLSESEREALIEDLADDARRGWQQMFFGNIAKGRALLRHIRDTTPHGELPDLDRIATDDSLIAEGVVPHPPRSGGGTWDTTFGVRSARVRMAEAWLIERYLSAKGIDP